MRFSNLKAAVEKHATRATNERLDAMVADHAGGVVIAAIQIFVATSQGLREEGSAPLKKWAQSS